MLDIVDDVVKFTFNRFKPDLNALDMHYTPKEYALRFRKESMEKQIEQGKRPEEEVDTLPFLSWVRKKVTESRFNQRLHKVGIPYDSPMVLEGGGQQNIPIQQVQADYDFMF